MNYCFKSLTLQISWGRTPNPSFICVPPGVESKPTPLTQCLYRLGRPAVCSLNELCLGAWVKKQGLKWPQPVWWSEFSSWEVQMNSAPFATGHENVSRFQSPRCGIWAKLLRDLSGLCTRRLVQAEESSKKKKRESSLLLPELQRCLTFSAWPSKDSVVFDPSLYFSSRASFTFFSHRYQGFD